MKKLMLRASLVALSIFIVSCGPKVPKGTYLITGTLTGVEDGTVITLYELKEETSELEQLDSTTLEGGRFVLKGEAGDTAVMRFLRIPSPVGLVRFWVASGKTIHVTGTDSLARTWYVKSTIPEQEAWNRFENNSRELTRKESSLYWEFLKSVQKHDKMSDGDTLKSEQHKHLMGLQEKRMAQSIQILHSDLDVLETELVSRVWYEKMEDVSKQIRMYNRQDSTLRKRTIALYENNLTDAEKATPKAEAIKDQLFPPSVIKPGEDMADADLYDLEGNLRHLSDYKGKYLLLDFWSRGCGPCIMAIPEMKELSETYADRLILISLSSDSKEQWEKASAEHEIDWVNLNQFKGMRGLFANYGVRGIPHYVVISPEGKVITSWSGYGPGNIKEKIAKVLP